MAIAMRDAMRAGLVSGKVAAKYKDEGHPRNKGAVSKGELDARAHQKRGPAPAGKSGGGVSKYAPGRKMIDQFPEKRPPFPKESAVRGAVGQKGVPNPRSKGGPIATSGGPGGGNASNKEYYGGPKPRKREQ